MLKYRTEMSVDSERRAIPLMLFEITELHNPDILEYVANNYNLPGILKRNIRDYIDNIYNLEEGDGVVEYMLKEILGCIEDETGKNIKYAIWLADKDAVEEMYEGTERDIFAYDVSDAVVLSDLGYDGTLYGFEQMPEPVEEEIDESAKGRLSYEDKRAIYESVMTEISRLVKRRFNIQ